MSNLSINHPDHAANGKQLFGHPVGLYILFFTELWERFSYYGMRALFVLFLTASVTSENSGFGWDSGRALELYGWYTMMVYVASIPGGILADKVFGQKKMVVIGGVLLCIGHGVLAIEALWAWYAGITLIVLGVGGLKPNISTMVGGLYKQKDERRDIAFTIFYIGINIGAFLAGLIIGPLGENVNWHFGFGLAGAGMVVGQILFIWGTRFLKGVGEVDKGEETFGGNSKPKESSYLSKLFGNITALLSNILVFVVGAYLLFDGTVGYGLLVMGVSFFVGFFIVMLAELEGKERDRVVVLILSYLIVIIFWGAFEQAGGLMNLYASDKTDRLISILNLDIIFGIAILGLVVRGVYSKVKKSNGMYWFIGAGFLLLAFILLRMLVFTASGGEAPLGFYEVPATVFQSVNSFFIFTLGTLVAFYWYNRKMKGKESSSLFKMAMGVIIMGLGFTFMSIATKEWAANGSSAMYWLVLAYMFHTIGELCASPVAMSFITKLAPAKYVSIMMGFYFAATGFGNKLAGELGELSTSAGEFEVFTGITIFCVVFGLLVIALLKPLKRLTHGAEDASPVVAIEEEGYSRRDTVEV
ncbi:peptide MFS transporter [Fulvivirga sp. 29W222]|uniref:Peptide MFS transporter n=1 Tax=Fulvivirga marina TaxID=2494733 RepID=A0A937G3G8_9BACT|nr:peptide MFS transporter [Fulvivirga marina]MBL6450012.1 peptide MFS transporter [Fulvivirga marina]